MRRKEEKNKRKEVWWNNNSIWIEGVERTWEGQKEGWRRIKFQ